MKIKIEFVNGSIAIITNAIVVTVDTAERILNVNIEEIPLELVSRVTVDGDVIYDHMGRKENHKKEKLI